MKNQLSTRTAEFCGAVALRRCPRCAELQVAPSVSIHVSEVDVRHFWSCDDCGHQFVTPVRIANTTPAQMRRA